MEIRLVMCVLTSAVIYVRGQSSLGKCTRPDGDQGLCIPYDQCPWIMQEIHNKTRSTLELTEYLCGSDGNKPKVCCDYNCYTPDGHLGKCKNMRSCQHLNEMSRYNNENYIAYVRDSRCLTGKNDVCCGPPPAVDFDQSRKGCEDRMSAFPPHLNSMCCGIDITVPINFLGGNYPIIDQYPWLARLEYKNNDTGEIKSYCGGALISNRYVVTAAHCITGSGFWPPIRVTLGEYDTSTEEDCVYNDCADPVVKVDIEDIITHPGYNLNINNWNDIALIRLASPVPFTDFVRPICMPAPNVLRRATEAVVAGWGNVNMTQRSNTKMHLKVPMIPIRDCRYSSSSWIGNLPQLWSRQLCAGGAAGKDSCIGDSGGPLMLQTGQLYELIGVSSFGHRNCSITNMPRVYTHVHAYSAWIRRNIRP